MKEIEKKRKELDDRQAKAEAKQAKLFDLKLKDEPKPEDKKKPAPPEDKPEEAKALKIYGQGFWRANVRGGGASVIRSAEELVAASGQPDKAKETLLHTARRWGVQIIAIGNGTASRETEALVAEVIRGREDGRGEMGVGRGAESGARRTVHR